MKLKREPAEQTPEQVFAIAADKIAHDLKIIEISRRVMGRSKRVLPFALIGVVLTGFPLLASILSVSPFGILLFGGLFSGAMSQLVGPYGSWSRLQSEPKKIEGRIDSLQEGLANFPTVASFVVFGVKSISKSKIVFFREITPARRGRTIEHEQEWIGFNACSVQVSRCGYGGARWNADMFT